MGPGDPLATRLSSSQVEEISEDISPAADRFHAKETSPYTIGFGVGVAFGLLALAVGVTQALIVASCGVVGASLAHLVVVTRGRSVDPRAALAALFPRRNLR